MGGAKHDRAAAARERGPAFASRREVFQAAVGETYEALAMAFNDLREIRRLAEDENAPALDRTKAYENLYGRVSIPWLPARFALRPPLQFRPGETVIHLKHVIGRFLAEDAPNGPAIGFELQALQRHAA